MPGSVASARLHYGIALFLGFTIAAYFIAMVTPIASLYSNPDTSSYLEAARHFMEGKGLVVSTGLDSWALATEPLSLWPPGFPIAVALASKLFGLDPVWLAPRLVWLIWALLPVAFLFAFRPVLDSRHIHVISVLVMLSPGAVENAWQAMTDIPFLFLTILSFGILLRATSRMDQPVLLVLSGFLAGLAYSIRNVGLAWFAAIFATYIILTLLKQLSPRLALRRLVLIGAGASLIVIPILVRNVTVLGALQPYDMPPSQVTFFDNVRYFVASWINDILPLRGILFSVLWNNAVFISLGTGILILAWVTRRRLERVWGELSRHAKELFIVLVGYALVGAALVIVARSRYEWGEFIGVRHVLQYNWVLFCLCALLVERWRPTPRIVPAFLLTAVVALIGLRVWFVENYLAVRREDFAILSRSVDPVSLSDIRTDFRYLLAMRFIIAHDQQLMQAIRDLPPSTVIVSNYNDVLKTGTGRVVHRLIFERDCDLPEQLAVLGRDRSSLRDVSVILFAKREIVRSGCWERLQALSQDRSSLGLTRPYLITLTAEEIGLNRREVTP